MKCKQFKNNRRSIRLHGYDYSSSGTYFITICAYKHQCLFGDICTRDGGHCEMILNDTGTIVTEEWIKTAKIRKKIKLDEWIVMPNHLHGILVITDDRARQRQRARQRCARTTTATTTEGFGQPVRDSIPTIIRSFKSVVTKRINRLHQTPGGKLWQRNYWEHIVRNESELNHIREYIRNNPIQWELDKLNPGYITNNDKK